VSAPGEAPAAIRRLGAARGSAVVVVFGGDGTINRLLPDLLAARLPLAVFPAGTVNDFATQMGLSADWDELAEGIAQGRRRAVDLVAVNGRPFVTYASIGLGARTSGWAARTRAVLAPLRRVAPTLIAPLNAAATVILDREYWRSLRFEDAAGTRVVSSPGVYVSNLPRLNRTIRLSAAVGTAGGTFGSYILDCNSRLDLLKTIFTLQKRKDIAAIGSRMQVWSGQWLTVSDNGNVPFDVYGDGEFLLRTETAHFAVMPAALEVCLPDAPNANDSCSSTFG